MKSTVLLLLSAVNFVSSLSGTRTGHCGFPGGAPRNSLYSNSQVSKSFENRCGKFGPNLIAVISNCCGQEDRETSWTLQNL